MKKEKTANLCHILWKIFPFIGTAIWGVFCITDNLGYDEAYTAALISHPVGELVEITAQDVHAPFYYILFRRLRNARIPHKYGIFFVIK